MTLLRSHDTPKTSLQRYLSSPCAAMGMGYPRAHLLLLFLEAHICVVSLGTAALSFSYNFSIPDPGGLADLTYVNGSARGRDVLYLSVPGKTNSSGRAFYPHPVRLWDGNTVASFNSSFSFAMITSSNNPNTTQLARGEGMAFFIGPFPSSLPPVSGGPFLGLFSNGNPSPAAPATVGVEFDTHWDRDWDPKDIAAADHVGIDLNSIRSGSYTKDLAKGDLSGTMSADITYDGGSKLMVVTLRLTDGRTRSIQALIDFRDAGVPQEVAVGFSAATGVDVVQTNLLLSWSFSSTELMSVSSKMPLWLIISLSVACPLLAASIVAAVFYTIMRRHRCAPGIKIALQVAKEFSYNELSESTNNFSEDRKLGAGSFGEVYRGELRDPGMPPVAVKKLTTRLRLPQTRRDYVTEIMTLGRLSHRNLVRLIGWCDGAGNDKLLLVYELVRNRSLEEHLHGQETPLLAWPERYKIVLGVGSAIDYLHNGYQNRILHRDIKPSNVMLDAAFEAKLGDFGLVRQVDPGEGSLRGTTMIGTRVYMDPVCISRDTVSTASDMYSFGVLLLEIATGMMPGEVHGTGAHVTNTLVAAVRESNGRGNVLEMADKRLKGNFDESQMTRVLHVGLLCAQLERKDRPDIRNAVNWLSNPSHPVPQLAA